MDYVYANIVNLEPGDAVVQSFETNPLFRFIRFYPTYDDPRLDTLEALVLRAAAARRRGLG